MSKSAWPPLGVLCLLLGACQAPVCEELGRAYGEAARKSQPCLERPPLPAFEAARCELRFDDACDAEDRARLEAQVDCYQQLATCVPGQQEAFLEAVTRCDAHAPSNACEAAIFQGSPGAREARDLDLEPSALLTGNQPVRR
jgi:hypothetical protein